MLCGTALKQHGLLKSAVRRVIAARLARDTTAIPVLPGLSDSRNPVPRVKTDTPRENAPASIGAAPGAPASAMRLLSVS